MQPWTWLALTSFAPVASVAPVAWAASRDTSLAAWAAWVASATEAALTSLVSWLRKRVEYGRIIYHYTGTIVCNYISLTSRVVGFMCAITTNTFIYWLVVSISLKNMKVSWDDFPFPIWWKNKSHVPNHQPDKKYHNHQAKMDHMAMSHNPGT